VFEIIVKGQFSVIGKMGKGLAIEGSNWIPSLWQEANNNFAEISNLAKLDAEGNIAGIWGAMSDVNDKFEGWQVEGKYLAGCEALDDAVPPIGWTKWVVPAFKYAISRCTQDSYKDTLHRMIAEYLPQDNYKIVGAIQEFYNPKDNNGELSLYFPVEKI
jgi:predicted transcriptional regulator YdeE